VILGGGTGGVVVANTLAKKIGKENDIIVIDKQENHVFNPSLLWIIDGSREGEQIQRPLSRLQRKGITFVKADVLNINFEGKNVSTSGGEFEYDFLVVALGATMYPSRLSGFAEVAHNIYDVEGVEQFTSELGKLEKGRVIVAISSMPFKCPAAPYEAAFFIKSHTEKYSKDVQVDVITPEPGPMGVAGEELSSAVVSMLQDRNIGFYPLHHIESIDPQTKEISIQDGKSFPADLIAGIPTHGIPAALENSPILGESGWVKVDPFALETDVEGVFAIGDVTDIPLTLGKPLPKAGVFAHHQAEVVAKRIISSVKGESMTDRFKGDGSCFLEIGGGKSAFASGNFYTQPLPVVKLKMPSRFRHWQKVIFEKYWLRKWL
ncbi:MAG: NAD(P)/FAD-dependent oxidoreductase, partial [Candidatus Kariarchaeaceae archaeon]|jgi:sulfide:quinone oxidoreductase